MFLNKTLWLWCCSLCYLNGSHPWTPIHIVRLCPHAKPDRTSLWCLFIHAAIYYCLCFLTVQGTWLPKIQCNSIIAASACNHKVLHTHTHSAIAILALFCLCTLQREEREGEFRDILLPTNELLPAIQATHLLLSPAVLHYHVWCDGRFCLHPIQGDE